MKFRGWINRKTPVTFDFQTLVGDKVGVPCVEVNGVFVSIHVLGELELSTDRKDKNGNEIFAGDIIRYLNNTEYTQKEYWLPIFKVVADNGWGFHLSYIGGGLKSDALFNLRHHSSKFEIIGNVHQTQTILIHSETNEIIATHNK